MMKKFLLILLILNHLFGVFLLRKLPDPVSYDVARLHMNYSDFAAVPIVSEMEQYLQNNLDTTIKPCDNFYKHVCTKYTQLGIPPDKESLNQFDMLTDNVHRDLRNLFQQQTFKNKDWNFVRTFVNVQNLYKSCINRGMLLHLGTSQVEEKIKALGGWPLVEKENWKESEFNWIKFTYKLRDLGLKWNHFLNVFVDIDRSSLNRRIVWIDEGSNYFSSVLLLGGINSRTVQQYLVYQTDISMYFGASRLRATQEFKEAMEFAVKIAKIQMTPEEKHDITKHNKKYTIKKLTRDLPFVPWLEYINTLFKGRAALTKDEEVNVPSIRYLEKLGQILQDTPKRVIGNYLMWFVLKESVPYLADHIKAKVNALNQDVSGLNVDVPLWKECVDIVTLALPLPANALYAWYLNETEKSRKSQATELMNHIKSASRRYLLSNYWMDDNTRKKAVEKLDAMRFYVAYPDEVFKKDTLDGVYQNLEMHPDQFYKNMLLANRADIEREISLLRKPIDKSDWTNHVWSIEINAGYTPDENSIMVSAGILQGIFFNTEQIRALNYGSLGFIIGHEITHGFDNMGRHFDKEGKMVPWWGNSTEKKFEVKSNCVEALNNRTIIRDANGIDYQLNGLLTQGETISDIGGIKLAYHAYLESGKEKGPEKHHPLLESYSSRQLFWLAAAATWCSKSRPTMMEEWRSTRAHPPDEHRVNSAVSNNVDFAQDFKCPLGSPMNPYNKCIIWYEFYFLKPKWLGFLMFEINLLSFSTFHRWISTVTEILFISI